MALIECADCGRKISTQAKSCPQCGCPNDPNVSEDRFHHINSKEAIIADDVIVKVPMPKHPWLFWALLACLPGISIGTYLIWSVINHSGYAANQYKNGNSSQTAHVATMPSSLCGDWYVSQFMDSSGIVQPGPSGGQLSFRVGSHAIMLMTGPDKGSTFRLLTVADGTIETGGRSYPVTVFNNDGQSLIYKIVTQPTDAGRRPLFVYEIVNHVSSLLASMEVVIH